MSKLGILATLGLFGLVAFGLATWHLSAAGDRAAEFGAGEICAWVRSAEPEEALDRKLGMGPEGRSFLVILRDERTPIECSPSSSLYSESLGERAVAIRSGGHVVVNFRIASTLRGPRVLGYWTSTPMPSTT